MTRYHLLVCVDKRWTVVTVDTVANQVTVPNVDRFGRYCVGGTGRASIERAARYVHAHRPDRSYSTKRNAQRALAREGFHVRVDDDGDLIVEEQEELFGGTS